MQKELYDKPYLMIDSDYHYFTFTKKFVSLIGSLKQLHGNSLFRLKIAFPKLNAPFIS
jgi:hypothetical protein